MTKRRPRALPLALAVAALTALPAARLLADENIQPPRNLTPEYELTVSDPAELRRLFRENAWMKDFQGSNLYRGTMARLGPVLFALAREGTDSWKGRLLDFVVENLVDGRPTTLSYFHAPDLASPFGVTVSGLTPRATKALALLLDRQRTRADVPILVSVLNGTYESVSVTPVAFKGQKFAAVASGSCLSVGRDPAVAAALSYRCGGRATALPGSATLSVDTAAFFSSWSTVLEKLFGVGPSFRASFSFDSAKSRYVPAKAELALRKGHLLGTAPLDSSLLSAIPADALFFATALIPDPGALSPEGAEEYLRTIKAKPPARYVPVALVYLGMRAEGRDNGGSTAARTEALSVLLLPQPRSGDAAQAAVGRLFGSTRRYRVEASYACPGYAAISPSPTALARIEAACSRKAPSFLQLSPRLVQSFARRPLSAGVFVNVGSYLRHAMTLGWDLANAGTPAGAERAAKPPEVADGLALLDRLPMFAFAGAVQGDAILLTGVEP